MHARTQLSTLLHPATALAVCAALSACSSKGATSKQTTPAPQAKRPGPRAPAATTKIGRVNFEISCASRAQREFNEALTLLHHMMYAQAEGRFKALADRHPDCAMAHWGIAMSLFHPLWPDTPSARALQRGTSEIARAAALPATRRERLYIAAARAYYQNWQRLDEARRLTNFARALAQLHQRYPRDVDAAAFYALSLLATAPSGDSTYRHQRQAAAMLSRLYQSHPRHPGVIHYGIHAHDFPPLAAAGLILADAYEPIAPNVPHALHMPSHIYVRLGLWEKTAGWNRRSAKAARAQSMGNKVSKHRIHAMDYLVYAYLQRMHDDKALGVLEEIYAHKRYQSEPITAYGLAAIIARIPLERRRWQDAMALRIENLQTGFDWRAHPEARAVIAYARGLSAARARKLDIARVALAELGQIIAELQVASARASKQRFWLERARIQQDSVAAWIAHVEGSHSRARDLMRAAAEREDVLGKSPVMPEFVQPARELYAELLLEQERPREALVEFQQSLRQSPRRANSLHGAANAARMVGDERQATLYLVELVALPGSVRPNRLIYVDAAHRLMRTRTTQVFTPFNLHLLPPALCYRGTPRTRSLMSTAASPPTRR